jgi:hypothetical protein
MSGTTTWGSYTIVNPSEFPGKEETVGSEAIMDDGTLKAEVVARKWRRTPKWFRLLAADRDTLHAAYVANLVPPGAEFTFPDGVALTVVPVGGGWEEVPYWYQGENIFRYDVTLVLREV